MSLPSDLTMLCPFGGEGDCPHELQIWIDPGDRDLGLGPGIFDAEGCEHLDQLDPAGWRRLWEYVQDAARERAEEARIAATDRWTEA